MSSPFFNAPNFFAAKGQIQIPSDCPIVFVTDMFIEDYKGGAELTTEALISSSPFKVFKLHAKDVTMDLLSDGVDRHWIFGNFASLNQNLIPSIVANLKYSILEYDYKYCKYRSPEKHESIEMNPCDCDQQIHGKMISAFFYQARSLWWMSEIQMERYMSVFPFLRDKNNTVLSSVFDETFFAKVKVLRESRKDSVRKGWVFLGGTSWIKGVDDAKDWCVSQGHEYEMLWGLSYDQVLEKLSLAEGLVFLPKGGDTCPRMVIEAKLLGCKLHLNQNVEHAKEIWFDTDNLLDTESYLYMARQRFWAGVKSDMDYHPTISGYTTTYNCQKQGYPYQESIKSMLGFCDQVVVVDGGSSDGTWEWLVDFSGRDERLIVKQISRDWNDVRFAVFDGMQKAAARDLCTQEFCWQQDSDEIVHQNDQSKIRDITRNFPASIKLLSLPVIEYWGGTEKVRMDIFPWKWRLSRNDASITHGIPKHLRKTDSEGRVFASPGTDGCDYIDRSTGEPVPHASFYTRDVDQLRQTALQKDADPMLASKYQTWFRMMTQELPSVHHYSWFDLPRKIRTYRDYWTRHWLSLYDIKQTDTGENNMFFGKPWADVTEQEIDELADKLRVQMGGWIFHRPLTFEDKTPHITVDQTHPEIMCDWVESHGRKI